jgi:hypothetical protein
MVTPLRGLMVTRRWNPGERAIQMGWVEGSRSGAGYRVIASAKLSKFST